MQEIKNVYDAIIIGAGLGGLTTGALLAKKGHKVLVIESHDKPGGYATTFKRKNYTFEVSLHETTKSHIENVLHEADAENVEFIPVRNLRFKTNTLDVTLPDNSFKVQEVLFDMFPLEKRSIKKFFLFLEHVNGLIESLESKSLSNKLYSLARFMLIMLRYGKKTLGEFLDETFCDEQLKILLALNAGFYHDQIYELSFLYFAIAQADFFSSGAYYIKGGSQKLSNALVKVIEQNNGKVILQHEVTNILIENKKVSGVEYQNALGMETILHKAFSKIVVANNALPNVPQMLPKNEAKKIKKSIKQKSISCSFFCIYIAFKRPLSEIGYNNYICGFGYNSQSLRNFAESFKHEDYGKRLFGFVNYSHVDSALAPSGKGIGTITLLDDLKNWENVTDKEYKDKKERVAQIFLERIEEFIPGFKDEIEFYEVATPKTMKRYTQNTNGTAYGFANIPSQVIFKNLQNKSPINGLYFASAWAHPGGGFTGAVLSGKYCADRILG
jgi:phytoene dehydrogenase-like protein